MTERHWRSHFGRLLEKKSWSGENIVSDMLRSDTDGAVLFPDHGNFFVTSLRNFDEAHRTLEVVECSAIRGGWTPQPSSWWPSTGFLLLPTLKD